MVINIYIFKNSFKLIFCFVFLKRHNMLKSTQNDKNKIIILSRRWNGSIKQYSYILTQLKNDIEGSNMVSTSKMTFKYVI